MDLEAEISVVHIFEEHTVVMAGGEHILMQVLDRDFQVSAPSFFQVNTPMAGHRMVEHVLTNLPAATSTILDVYCGAGLFSAFLAARCDRLIGIEFVALGLRRLHCQPGGVRQCRVVRRCGRERAPEPACQSRSRPGRPAACRSGPCCIGCHRSHTAGIPDLCLL